VVYNIEQNGLSPERELTCLRLIMPTREVYKINVNSIAPGFFPSEMTASVFQDEKAMQHILSRTPLGRTGDPLDLKAALTYLSSPASDYVTGQTIFVDGGWTAL
jgi:2-deoxy-D-gluconate 3-dehydrogenase